MEKMEIEIGSFHKFGELGVVYEILDIKDTTARIRVIESGEELDYPVDRISNDPVAH